MVNRCYKEGIMPAIANIVIADAVPANHTFVPLAANVGEAQHVNRNGNIAASNEVLILNYSPASSKRKTDRIRFRLTDPLERGNATDGYTADDKMFIDVTAVIPESATPTERSNFATLAKNLMANTVVLGYISSGDPEY